MADQLQFSFEPVGHEQWENLREYLDDEVITDYCKKNNLQRKYLAADLGLSPSRFKRKLVPSDGDTSRFTTDDLETWLEKTRDLRPLYYLFDKYGNVEDEEAELLSRLAEVRARKRSSSG